MNDEQQELFDELYAKKETIENKAIWAQAVPDNPPPHVMNEVSTRGEWADELYHFVYAIEESTTSWTQSLSPFIDHIIRYFKFYKMLHLAWWTHEFKRRCMSEYYNHVQGEFPIEVDGNRLRNLMHDEYIDPTGLYRTAGFRERIQIAHDEHEGR